MESGARIFSAKDGSFMLLPEDQFVDMGAICGPDTTAEKDGKAKRPLWGIVNTLAVKDMDETAGKGLAVWGEDFPVSFDLFSSWVVIFGGLFSHTNQILVGNRYLVEKWGQFPKSLIQMEIFCIIFVGTLGLICRALFFFHRLM
jgi:hypothetical protein